MHLLRRLIGAAWRALVGAADYWSNGDRRRPPFAEDSTIYNPSAGWGRRDAVADEGDAEHGVRRD